MRTHLPMLGDALQIRFSVTIVSQHTPHKHTQTHSAYSTTTYHHKISKFQISFSRFIFAVPPSYPPFAVALNDYTGSPRGPYNGFDNTLSCGTCFQITGAFALAMTLFWVKQFVSHDVQPGPKGSIKVIVTGANNYPQYGSCSNTVFIDWCPPRDCNTTTPHFDLSNEGLQAIAPSTGPTVVSFMRVSCDVVGNLMMRTHDWNEFGFVCLICLFHECMRDLQHSDILERLF